MESPAKKRKIYGMPPIGFGTYKLGETEECVLKALQTGYRVIDTAQIYKNEKSVGKAMKQKIQHVVKVLEKCYCFSNTK